MHEYSNTFGVQTPVSFLCGLKVVIGVIYGKFFFGGGIYGKTTWEIRAKLPKPPSQRMPSHHWEPPTRSCRHRSECVLHAPWNSYWGNPSGCPMVRCPMPDLRTPRPLTLLFSSMFVLQNEAMYWWWSRHDPRSWTKVYSTTPRRNCARGLTKKWSAGHGQDSRPMKSG